MCTIVVIFLISFQNPAPTLTKEAIEFSLTENNTKTFSIDVAKNDWVRLSLTQNKIYPIIEIINPDGALEKKIRRTNNSKADLLVSFHATKTGKYIVKARAIDAEKLEQEHQLSIKILDHLNKASFLLQQKMHRNTAEVTWIKENVKNFNLENINEEALSSIADAIGDSRIVMLGEQAHGESEVISAKVKLIEYLHKNKGFEIVAFESGFYEINELKKLLEERDIPNNEFRNAVYPLWADMKEFYVFSDYYKSKRKGDRPLDIWGLDHLFRENYAKTQLKEQLLAYVENENIKLHGDHDSFFKILESALNYDYYFGKKDSLTTIDQSFFYYNLEMIQDHAAQDVEKKPTPQNKVFLQTLKSFKSRLPNFLTNREIFDAEPRNKNIRDKQMADNLIWLAEEMHPNKKIIVWAATTHLFKNCDKISFLYERDAYDFVSLGHRAWEHFGKDIFIIGFTAYSGTFNNAYWRVESEDDLLSYNINSDQHESLELEEVCDLAGLDNGFINFRAENLPSWLKKPMVSRPFGHEAYKGIWPNHLDGMIYMKKVTPLNYIYPFKK